MDHREIKSMIVPTPHIRPYRASDDVSIITDLLHKAYKPLADIGLHFMATHQDDSVTLSRLTSGESFLAFIDEQLVATVSLYLSYSSSDCDYYCREGVAHFGQLGVDPTLKGNGIGSTLIAFVEQRAREFGSKEMALDTAMPATHLISYYEKLGYRKVDEVQWPDVNYRSQIMAKTL